MANGKTKLNLDTLDYTSLKDEMDANAGIKKTLITAKVNETTLKAWKQFCLDKDITLTDAIKRAMTHYIKDVQNGTIEI